ncbi:YceI family protein [Pseudothauera rhizosphaerae]|uniref:YceI family protein n=1 Tax=Pseudothauera rhizosphaerae TaxID=2565932 RepID=A0A4S4A9A4_9RHOO|nr:YceI family protein [Pseudothauera rhizosphaerae]THF55385.1 YceI family protein [Pseudothauera rhizosphaerae]
MNKRFALFASAATLAAALAAPALAAPETYVIDNTHTFPRFEYSHFGFSNQIHRFNTTKGTIVWDREARTGAVDITIDTTSVDTGYALFDEHIQGEDFLDTANHPTITYKSTAVRFDGDKPVAIDGELTIKGVTRPVTLTLTSFHSMPHPMARKPALGANAVAQIKRSEFNAGKFAPNVSDEVTLSIAVEAIQQ